MIDIIIATYNRPKVVCEFVSDVESRKIPQLNSIIIVDSSDEINEDVKKYESVKYIHSKHKNQPYQRYLGYKYSKAESLLYLDDDMQLLDERVFSKIEDIMNKPNIAGINLLFTNKSDFLSNLPKQSYKKMPKCIRKFIHWFTANPELPDGKYWYCGCRGRRVDNEYSEYFSGGAFCAKREKLYINFDFNVFNLFEKKIGMGEDMILAYTLSKQGKIYNLPGSYFFHNDTGTSTYTANNKYNYRVAYSRLYISLQYARLNHESKIKAVTITMWYHLWRFVGQLFLCFRHSHFPFGSLWRYLQGSLESLGLVFEQESHGYWIEEIRDNLNANNYAAN